MDATAEGMLAICHRFDEAEVQAFLPYLLVTFAPAIDANKAPAAAAAVGVLAQRLGVAKAEDAAAAFRAHFEANPPNPKLVEEFERFFREQLKGTLPDGAAEGLAKVIGSDDPSGARALSTVGGERPAGTVAASPFARFQVQTPTQSKKGS